VAQLALEVTRASAASVMTFSSTKIAAPIRAARLRASLGRASISCSLPPTRVLIVA